MLVKTNLQTTRTLCEIILHFVILCFWTYFPFWLKQWTSVDNCEMKFLFTYIKSKQRDLCNKVTKLSEGWSQICDESCQVVIWVSCVGNFTLCLGIILVVVDMVNSCPMVCCGIDNVLDKSQCIKCLSYEGSCFIVECLPQLWFPHV